MEVEPLHRVLPYLTTFPLSYSHPSTAPATLVQEGTEETMADQLPT